MVPTPPQWILASSNPGKFNELSALFAPLGVSLISQTALGVPDAPEPHHTFLENALAKARYASAAAQLPALADDSGLVVPALNGAPGVQSAVYAGESGSRQERDARNNQKLLQALKQVSDRRAFYVCVLVFVQHANDPYPIVAQATWSGAIIDTARGQGGFGYDPYFFLPSLGQTAAELAPEQKNRLSHRAQALQQLLAQCSALTR
jgi:XTP/dITP diphosphohydrolase